MSESPPQELRVNGAVVVRRLVLALIGLQLGLGVLDFTFAYHRVIDVKLVQRLCNLAREDSVATWFAASQAQWIAIVLLALAVSRRALGRRGAAGWGLLAAFFALVSVDDALGIHERAGGALRRGLFANGAEWFPSYSWQLMFGPILVAMGLFMLVFLARTLAPHLRPWIAGALVVIVLAIGLDFVEGIDGAYEAIASATGLRKYTVSHLSKGVEEILEMAGTSMFLGAFLLQLVHDLGGRSVAFRSGSSGSDTA